MSLLPSQHLHSLLAKQGGTTQLRAAPPAPAAGQPTGGTDPPSQARDAAGLRSRGWAAGRALGAKAGGGGRGHSLAGFPIDLLIYFLISFPPPHSCFLRRGSAQLDWCRQQGDVPSSAGVGNPHAPSHRIPPTRETPFLPPHGWGKTTPNPPTQHLPRSVLGLPQAPLPFPRLFLPPSSSSSSPQCHNSLPPKIPATRAAGHPGPPPPPQGQGNKLGGSDRSVPLTPDPGGLTELPPTRCLGAARPAAPKAPERPDRGHPITPRLSRVGLRSGGPTPSPPHALGTHGEPPQSHLLHWDGAGRVKSPLAAPHPPRQSSGSDAPTHPRPPPLQNPHPRRSLCPPPCPQHLKSPAGPPYPAAGVTPRALTGSGPTAPGWRRSPRDWPWDGGGGPVPELTGENACHGNPRAVRGRAGPGRRGRGRRPGRGRARPSPPGEGLP